METPKKLSIVSISTINLEEIFELPKISNSLKAVFSICFRTAFLKLNVISFEIILNILL